MPHRPRGRILGQVLGQVLGRSLAGGGMQHGRPQGRLHATAVARGRQGVLLLGPSGSGKSDLALRLIHDGFVLIGDDRIDLVDGLASPAPGLEGLLEVRGLGILRLAYAAPIPIVLSLDLAAPPERLPEPLCGPGCALAFDGRSASAVARVALALDCLAPDGIPTLAVGAFAPRDRSDDPGL